MIRQLDPRVVARIAAGEVVERPASVVKELVENSLDAGASRIDVELRAAGLELIRVSDDGVGIPAQEVSLAFQRHTTSKIHEEDDLRRLSTLGFRGEALPSIAAAARVELSTRARGETVGARAIVERGEVVDQTGLGRGPGTSVLVTDLFADLPARRKFMRSPSAESSAVVQVVWRLALAFPEVAFSLAIDGRPIVATSGDGSRQQVLSACYGPAAADLLPIAAELIRDRERVVGAVSGYVGHGSALRTSRSGQSLFVNRRWVQNRSLLGAVDEAQHDLVPTGTFPICILDITVDPSEVDFNVHPAKAEVRLLRERALFAAARKTVRAALEAASLAGLDQAGEDAQSMFASELRLLGQARQTYIVAEGVEGVYLVDQHAAHERVLLEQLQRSLERESGTQLLLEPAVVEVGEWQPGSIDQLCAALTELGFESEPFGPRNVLVRAVPAPLSGRQVGPILADTLKALADDLGSNDWREKLATAISCRTAVRAGQALEPEEMLDLLRQLGESRLRAHCSHGRPTAILLSEADLERQFSRR